MTISPLEFFSHLRWIDERPLLDVIEPYRQRIFTETLYTFGEDGRPHYNLALTGRGKKNWKSADLILAALYRFLAWGSPQGNDCFLLANDEGQAGDDLKLLKKVIAINPLLDREVIVKQKEIERVDAKGTLKILPAQDAIGAHGKTYLFVGFDEIHGYRNWDIFEALAPDPTRLDALTYRQNADVFGTVEDLAAHKAKLAELEAKRKDLYARFPSAWAHGDLQIGRITSDGAALITFAKAPGEMPVHPFSTAGERLVEYLLR